MGNAHGKIKASSEVSEASDHQSVPDDVQTDCDVHSENGL